VLRKQITAEQPRHETQQQIDAVNRDIDNIKADIRRQQLTYEVRGSGVFKRAAAKTHTLRRMGLQHACMFDSAFIQLCWLRWLAAIVIVWVPYLRSGKEQRHMRQIMFVLAQGTLRTPFQNIVCYCLCRLLPRSVLLCSTRWQTC
jgi:hypothetical protein